MRGRKPKPLYMRLLDGNAGERPINRDAPDPPHNLAASPEWLSDSQKVGWRYAINSAPAGLLRHLDQSILTVWVVAEDLHRMAAEKVAKYGPIVKTPVTGAPIQSPYLSIMNKQAQIMMKAAAEMGFTPSSRARVKVEKSKQRDNAFADLRELGDD